MKTITTGSSREEIEEFLDAASWDMLDEMFMLIHVALNAKRCAFRLALRKELRRILRKGDVIRDVYGYKSLYVKRGRSMRMVVVHPINYGVVKKTDCKLFAANVATVYRRHHLIFSTNRFEKKWRKGH